MRSCITARPRMAGLILAALLVTVVMSAVPLAGCVLVHRHRAPVPTATVVYVEAAPPAPVVERRPPRPTPGAVWIDGHWQWNGHRYVWVSGYWDGQPKGKHWTPGHWDKKGRGWVWTPGHW